MSKDINKTIKGKIIFVYICIMMLMVFVIVKTMMIQANGVKNVFHTDDSNIPMRYVERPSRLGDILDENGNPLVTSVSKFDIYMDPVAPKQEDFDRYLPDLCRGLQKIYPNDINARDLEIRIRHARMRKSRYILIKSKATNEERVAMSKLPLFNLGRFKGGFIDTEEETIRKRPHGEMMRRLLGYYQPATKNQPELRVGIEGAFYDYLAGEPGQEVEQKLTTGWKRTGKIVKQAVEGASVLTSINNEIQEVAENELHNQLIRHNAISGSVIVMDVKTGFIKAMANLTRGEDGSYHESYNHAIGTKEVPGSTFKLASVMAALDDGKIKLTDTVQAAPSYDFFGTKLTEAEGHNYGRITIKQAFEKSSNVIGKVIYNAYKNDPKQFVDHLKKFGLNLPIGIDIEGEATPTMYSPGDPHWWAGSLAWMGVGYEVQLTPLQILTFYNAVANNGKMMKPQFVTKILRNDQVEKEFEPIVLRDNICTKKTLHLMQDCLYGVMKEGTGRYIRSPYFDIAGKTGTAEVLNDNNRYGKRGDKRYLASFVGYFPVQDPIYSCIVSITANGNNIYGASVSGRVFTAIANKVYASKLQYHKAINEQQVSDEVNVPIVKSGYAADIHTALEKLGIPNTGGKNSEWTGVSINQSKVDLTRRNITKQSIPNVVGMTAKDAVYILESQGLYVKVEGYGAVRHQSIPAGEPTGKYVGSQIVLTLE